MVFGVWEPVLEIRENFGNFDSGKRVNISDLTYIFSPFPIRVCNSYEIRALVRERIVQTALPFHKVDDQSIVRYCFLTAPQSGSLGINVLPVSRFAIRKTTRSMFDVLSCTIAVPCSK